MVGWLVGFQGGKAIHCANADGRPPEKHRGCDQRRRRLAPFHPGPGAHEFQGTALAYSHLGLLVEGIDAALDAIAAAASKRAGNDEEGLAEEEEEEVATKGGGDSAEAASLARHVAGERRSNLGDPFPPPIGCHPTYCGNASETHCFTTYEPHGPAAGLIDLVKGPRPPAMRHGTSGAFAGKNTAAASGSGWTLAVPPGLDFESHAAYGYLDFKYALFGRPSSGTLTLQFTVQPSTHKKKKSMTTTTTTTKTATTPVVVCQPQCPWGKCKADQRILDDVSSVRYRLDGVEATPIDEGALPSHDRPLVKKGVCCIVGYVKKPPSRATTHELSVDVKAGLVLISHLLWF